MAHTMFPALASLPSSAPQHFKPEVSNYSTFSPGLYDQLQRFTFHMLAHQAWAQVSSISEQLPDPPVPAPTPHSQHLGACSEQGQKVLDHKA